MAQNRKFNYKDDDKTDWLNRQHHGINPEGLYRGFDFDADNSAALNLVLEHTTTGWQETDLAQALTPFMGLVRTKQGVNVVEDASVVIPITDNPSADPRIDLVVCEHEYVSVVGGTAAGYLCIPGIPAANPVAPNPTFPLKQVVLGTLYLPAGTTAITDPGVVYTKADPPKFANHVGFVDFISYQTIVGTKKMHHVTGNVATMTYDSNDKKLTATELSNHYYLDTVLGQAENFLEVQTIEIPNNPGGLNEFMLHTYQRLSFRETNDPACNLSPADVNVVYNHGYIGNTHIPSMEVEIAKSVYIADMGITFGGGSTFYRISHGDNLHRSSVNKLYRQLITNKGNSTVDITKGYVNLDRKGNFYELGFDWATLVAGATGGQLRAIQHTNDAWDNVDPNTKQGNFVLLKIVDTGVVPTDSITLTDDYGVPAIDITFGFGIKPILTGVTGMQSGSGNITIKSGAFLLFVEELNRWRLVNMWDDDTNIYKVSWHYYQYVQYYAHHWQKIQSLNWYDLGGGGGVFNTATGDLIITDGANHFQATVPTADNGGTMRDIKMQTSSGLVSLPNGTEVTVRFLHSVFVPNVSEPFVFDLGAGSNLRCVINDSIKVSSGNAALLHINDGVYGVVGDIYRFRKSNGKWDILDGSDQAPYIYSRINANTQSITTLSSVPAWVAFSPVNADWVAGGVPYGPPRHRLDTQGRVKLTGVVVGTPGAPTAGTYFVLPAGRRPTVELIFSGVDSTGQAVVIYIRPNGNVDYSLPAVGAVVSGATVVSFDNIYFFIT